MTKDEIKALIDSMGLTLDAVFVPFSQSRNAKGKYKSLNWKVTLRRDGREVLTADYSAGCAHAPSYKQHFGRPTNNSRDRELMVEWECEHGYPARGVGFGTKVYGGSNAKNAILPDSCDVLHSLVLDADVLEHRGFEYWASNFGYDTDSRKAEAIYRACLDLALKLKNSLSDEQFAALRKAFQDY